MKQILLLVSLLMSFSFCPAQNKSSITTAQPKPKASATNLFIYNPPKNLAVPGKIQAVVVYQNKEKYFSKTINIDKVGNRYQFLFKAPDSTTVLIFSIIVPGKIIPEKSSLVVEKKMVFDNNEENGFTVDLHDNSGNKFKAAGTDFAGLYNNYAVYVHDLKARPAPLLLKMYEDTYKLHPELKKENAYLDYLSLLYKEKGEAVKPVLLNYANELLQIKHDEEKWMNARYVYNVLNMNVEKVRVEDEISTAFPDGNRAKGKYWNNFYAKPDTTEAAMLATMNAYTARFNDNTAKTKDQFYRSFIATSIARKDLLTALKYGELIDDKIMAAYQFDYDAWKLSGKQTDNPGTNLELAKIISARSIAISTALMNDGTKRDEDAQQDLADAHYKFNDTYALILYKLGQYDSAFYYQELVRKQGKELNTGGMERYAAYAEKAKDIPFTKQFLETKLFAGNKSPVMLKQLQGIYKQLNLPEDEFSRLQNMSLLLAKQKSDAAIIASYGSLKAPDFSLKNMRGETVTLSQLKNKIVVLDFWSTWCSPCKASFPTMQQLVDKYKDDQDIVFLFIDTWENGSPQKTQEAAKYITDNKYSFNVLFDIKNKVVTDYKIEEIPKSIVIDKNGNLLYTGGQTGLIFSTEHIIDEMSAVINDAKKIPAASAATNTKLPEPAFIRPKVY